MRGKLRGMQLPDQHIHIWTTDLCNPPDKELENLALLSEDEKSRANRFHFPVHKTRYIATRCVLRILLGEYLGVSPKTISFGYTEHKKPYLAGNHAMALQFNVSHSENLAVYAFTTNHAIGIDIEKVQDEEKTGIARRFFCEKENQALAALSPDDRIRAFYKIWAYKEAMIKATGKGLAIPLSSFSVSLEKDTQLITLNNEDWHLVALNLHPAFQAAVATTQTIKAVSCWKYYDETSIFDKVDKI